MFHYRCLFQRSCRPCLHSSFLRVATEQRMGKVKAQTQVTPQTKQDGKRNQNQSQAQPQTQQQRNERSAGGMRHYSSYLQVLALDIDHTSPSVLLFFNSERYLFNAGEGIQRLFREHKIKISQINSYFITRVSTETLGGMPGMALSVTPPDARGLLGKQAACTVKGPPGLASYVAAFRGYINYENTVAVEEFEHSTSEPVLKTDLVSITPILVRVTAWKTQTAAIADGDGDADGPAAKRQRTDAAGKTPAQVAEQDLQRPADLSEPDVAVYAIQMAGRPGKFMPQRALELGVPQGKLFGELQRGLSVTTQSGRVVTPDDVMEPAMPGPSVLLLDTPSLDSLRAVAADERVRRFMDEAVASGGEDAAAVAANNRVCVVVHLIPAALVANEDAMAEWRALMGPTWRHVVVSSGPHQPSSISRATTFQAKLHALDPTCFPLFALENAAAPPSVPQAELEAAAAVSREAALKEAAAATSRSGGKRTGSKADGSREKAGAAAAAAAAAAAPEIAEPPADGKGKQGQAPVHVVQQLPSVLPLEPGCQIRAISAVRFNLVPLNRQGLEYTDVFKYDSSSKILDDIRSNSAYAPILAAAAEVRMPTATSLETASQLAVADGAEPEGAPECGCDSGMANGVKAEATGIKAAGGTDLDSDGRRGAPSAESVAGAAEARPATSPDQPIPEPLTSGDRRLAELTFLGTASSQPSKYRNVSGCYVDLFEAGGLLVDCGEDAMGQLKRRFGNADAEHRLLNQLTCVWVSHMHADHHGGLYRLLEWRARRGAAPLLVIGPYQLFNVLVRYSAVVPIQFIFLPNAALSSGRIEGNGQLPAVTTAAYQGAKDRLGLAALKPFPVDHIKDAHGLVLEGRAGWRLVFSGDTRPCQKTVDAARGATLLVHEATFEESMQAEARAKRHSTTAEAVGVGEKAGVYRTVLTHFSTRYPTLPELDLSRHPRVAVAMDLMSINLADLPWLPRLVRPMGMLFKQLEAEKVSGGDDDDE
ncbi:hypothetical protein VaNZ11_002748 [Volvox africanus]|uniref:ribonuclease Z n=1 Tax=Volvox africanus TaxID=51714 RepID=A0ABQ5RSM2_9CHLO|nr:hypothetical protein VaNZ11_002748 [Volvox africanus]